MTISESPYHKSNSKKETRKNEKKNFQEKANSTVFMEEITNQGNQGFHNPCAVQLGPSSRKRVTPTPSKWGCVHVCACAIKSFHFHSASRVSVDRGIENAFGPVATVDERWGLRSPVLPLREAYFRFRQELRSESAALEHFGGIRKGEE